MSRNAEPEGQLRSCPTCGTKVADADLGMRDFRWVNDSLPGRIGLMDLDGCLTQAGTGRALFLELKPKAAPISQGARLTFALLASVPQFDVWVLWENGPQTVKLGKCGPDGTVGTPRTMTKHRAASLVRQWWDIGVQESKDA